METGLSVYAKAASLPLVVVKVMVKPPDRATGRVMI